MKEGKIFYMDDGKVIVGDYAKDSKNFAELKEYEYQDNIIELFEQENIVEELENEKKKLKKRILNNYATINIHEHLKKILTAIWIGMPLLSIFLGFLLSFNPSVMRPMFGIKQHWLSMGVVGTLITSIVVSLPFLASKNTLKLVVKENKGFELQLEELEKELEKNKEILNQLRNNKSKENQQQAIERKKENIHNIHLEKYRKIRSNLLLYREIGENENEFSEYYDKNILDEKLNDSYDPEEIEKIKTYFKSKK